MAMKKVFLKRKDGNYEDKIPIKFSIDTMNMIIAYIISDSDYITRGSLTNIRKLFRILDERVYEQDYQLIARFRFIKRALRARLDDYIDNPTVVLEYCRSNKYADVDDEIIEDVANLKLKATEIKYISSMVSDKLQYAFYFKYKDNLSSLLERLEKGEYESFKRLNKSFKKELTGLLTDIRKVDAVQSSDTTFSLGPELFENVVTQTVKKLQSPTNILRTNIQYLNEMLNGGFEANRMYLFMGLSGGFKSGTLLNMAYQIKMANLNYKQKDPLKTPTILYITQENSVEETVERLFALAVADNIEDRLKNYTPREAVKLLRNKGKLKLTRENNIDIVIKYHPGGSITTSDLYSDIDELEEEGAEVICLIHDYIKKLRSVQLCKELRIELGYITDELKALAVCRGIVVITATQLNRDAARTIDAGVECNKTDLARLLGASAVGESWMMIENSDWVGIINRERQLSEDRLYLTFKRLKIRYGSDKSIDYFNHPFKPNEFGLMDDVNLPTVLSKKYLSEGLIGVEEDKIIKFEKKGRSNAKERVTITHDDTDNKTNMSNLKDLFVS